MVLQQCLVQQDVENNIPKSTHQKVKKINQKVPEKSKNVSFQENQ